MGKEENTEGERKKSEKKREGEGKREGIKLGREETERESPAWLLLVLLPFLSPCLMLCPVAMACVHYSRPHTSSRLPTDLLPPRVLWSSSISQPDQPSVPNLQTSTQFSRISLCMPRAPACWRAPLELDNSACKKKRWLRPMLSAGHRVPGATASLSALAERMKEAWARGHLNLCSDGGRGGLSVDFLYLFFFLLCHS